MNLTPHRIPGFLPKLFPGLVWRIKEKDASKTIYLTFDDGPMPGPSEFVLEELAKYSAKATFFCIGDNVRKHPHVLKKILDGGHAIGNHTFNHVKGWSTSNEKYLSNVKLCDDELVLNGCPLSHLFRPPYGRISPNQIKSLSHYKIIMWDVLSLDYEQSGNEEDYLTGTIEATRPGSIAVFHDSLKAEKKMKFILPKYLKYFADQGFQFRKLT